MPFLQTGLKDVIDRARPTDPPVDLRAGFSSESFPAGHVMSPTYLYGVLLGYAWIGAMPRVVREPVAVWSLLIIVLSAPPNIWLGVHWPSDVLGGWAWGLVLAVPVVLVAQRVPAVQT